MNVIANTSKNTRATKDHQGIRPHMIVRINPMNAMMIETIVKGNAGMFNVVF